MLIRGRAAAKQAKRFAARIPELVLLPWWNGDGICGFDLTQFAFDPNPPRAARDVVDLLGVRMVMLLCAAAHRQARLGQTLVADDGIAIRQQFADFGTVLGDERRDLVEIFYIHGFQMWFQFQTCSQGRRRVNRLR